MAKGIEELEVQGDTLSDYLRLDEWEVSKRERMQGAVSAYDNTNDNGRM